MIWVLTICVLKILKSEYVTYLLKICITFFTIQAQIIWVVASLRAKNITSEIKIHSVYA
jgi:hypothetical protein